MPSVGSNGAGGGFGSGGTYLMPKFHFPVVGARGGYDPGSMGMIGSGSGSLSGGNSKNSVDANRVKSLQVFVDGKIFPYKYVTVDIDTAVNGGRLKVFHHDGSTRVYSGGQETRSLELIARIERQILHIWVNGKEIKPSNATIKIT
ncbi:MAG: hypothetical protein KDB79_12675, partial [Acidobacteria bacterium]|nr:hypothetical protein [Acidobacteriota bacterium]